MASATDVEERIDRHDGIDTDVTEPTSKDCPIIIGGAAAALDYGNRSFGSSSRRPLTKAQAKNRACFPPGTALAVDKHGRPAHVGAILDLSNKKLSDVRTGDHAVAPLRRLIEDFVPPRPSPAA